MNKIVYLFLVGMLSTWSYAQNKNVNKSKSALDKGEIAEALEWIEPAIQDEKTKDKGKTWYTRALVYDSIALSSDPDVIGLVDSQGKAVEEAVNSYKKTIELDGEKSSYGGLSIIALESLWGNLLNKGASYFEKEDREKALEFFEYTQKVKPEDSTAYLYAGIAAQQMEDFDKAAENYEKLVEMGSASEDVFSSLIYIKRAVQKNMEGALDVVNQAKEQYPRNTTFPKEEISLLLNLDRLDEAKDKLVNAIEQEPDNANLRLNLAILYDNAYKAKRKDDAPEEELNSLFNNAVEAYKKTIELDPANLIANFNLAVFYNEKANEYFAEVNAMDIKEYQKRGQQLVEKGNEYIKNALPYMEKAYEIQPDDVDTIGALQVFYNRLKMNDKAMEMQDKLDEIEAGG